MRTWLAIGGAVALLASGAGAAFMGDADPFVTAAYDISIKHNDEALAIIDSGQFEINMQNEEGYTLLHLAADNGNLEMVRALLTRGADARLKTAGGLTPYDVAMGTMVKALLAKAMQAPVMTSTAPIAGTDARGAANVATGTARGGNGSCAAVIGETANNGRSAAMRPILRARDDIWYNHPDELALLLDDCVDANMRDDVGSMLLHTAASRDRIEAAKVLLAHGADRRAADRDGRIPADYASSAEMRALLGPPSAAARVSPAGDAGPADATRKRECAQKQMADAALCSDSSCKMRTYSHWQKCLETGEYW